MPDDAFARNQQWVKPGEHSYQTALSPEDERAFDWWVWQNKVPFDFNTPTPDYDMRGFYQALQRGDERAKSAVNPNDGAMHYPDYWKTPHHKTFSRESQWATPDAPYWTEDDKLVDAQGNVIFDERAAKRK